MTIEELEGTSTGLVPNRPLADNFGFSDGCKGEASWSFPVPGAEVA